jgi:hypothetical protein
MNRCDIRTGFGRQQRERVTASGHPSPQARKAEPVLSSFREFPFGLRRPFSRELVKVRRRHQTSADWKAPFLGTEIDNRRPFGLGRRKAPAQLDKFVAMVCLANDRRCIGGPDIIARLKVRRGARPAYWNARLAERAQVVVIWDVVAEIVAHAKIPERIAELSERVACWPPTNGRVQTSSADCLGRRVHSQYLNGMKYYPQRSIETIKQRVAILCLAPEHARILPVRCEHGLLQRRLA